MIDLILTLGFFKMNHSENFTLKQDRKGVVFYAASSEIDESSILEAINACGGIDGYKWCAENHLNIYKRWICDSYLTQY